MELFGTQEANWHTNKKSRNYKLPCQWAFGDLKRIKLKLQYPLFLTVAKNNP